MESVGVEMASSASDATLSSTAAAAAAPPAGVTSLKVKAKKDVGQSPRYNRHHSIYSDQLKATPPNAGAWQRAARVTPLSRLRRAVAPSSLSPAADLCRFRCVYRAQPRPAAHFM